MIWVVLAFVAIVWIFIWWLLNDSFWTAVGMTCLFAVLLGLLALLLTFATSCIPAHEDKVFEMAEANTIVALSDSAGANGSFGFLGAGYVKDDLYYHYMIKNDVGYKAEKILASDTIIRYTSEDFKVEKYEATGFKRKSDHIFAVPTGKYYVVYIPEGSIIEGFRVDLE